MQAGDHITGHHHLSGGVAGNADKAEAQGFANGAATDDRSKRIKPKTGIKPGPLR